MTLKEMSENELASKMKSLSVNGKAKGEEFASCAREMFLRYKQRAYNISRYYGLNYDDSQDVIQISFLKTFNSIKRYDSKRDFQPWFYRIVLNCVKDKFNHKKKFRHQDLDNIEITSKNTFDEFHIREALNGIISGLPEKLKSVVVLRVYGEMDFESISKTLGVSVRQLHNRLNKAYEEIRKLIGEDDL